MSVWRRVDGDHCLGQSLVGEAEAMKARFAAEVAHKQKEGYMALGRKSRRGLPMWKDGSAVVIALAHSGLAANPVVLAGILREQLLRADSQAGVESLWGQYSALKARLEARLEYGAESGRARAREALESLVDGMRVALA
jgi:hypothetical protein